MNPKYLISYIITTLIIITLFRGISFLFRYLSAQKMKHIFPLIESGFWTIYLIATINYLLRHNGKVHIYWAYTLLIILILIFSWYALRDIISGIIWRSSNKFQENDKIRVDSTWGKIVAFKHRNIEIINDKEELIIIPYSKIIKSNIVKITSGEMICSQTFNMKINESTNISEQINEIYNYIISLPWTLIDNPPKIKVISAIEENQYLEIMIFAINQNYLFDTEMMVRNKFRTNQ